MLDPADRGGVYRMASELYGVLERWGWMPSLLYLSAVPEDGLSPRQLLARRKIFHAVPKMNRGMRGLAVGHVPARFYALASLWPYRMIGRHLDSFSAHLVLGTADRGITLAMRRNAYVCWLATSLEDEFEARAALGDGWARALMSSPQWPLVLWTERLALKRSALVIALSEHTAERLRRICPSLDGRVRVIPCPVDTDTFRPLPHSNARKGGTRDFSILFVGRVGDRRKNVPMLLRAFRLVLQRQPHARLTMVGGSSPDLLSLVDDLGMAESVEFVPILEEASELAAWYQRAQLFVLPSKQEGLGIVVQEAMAAGLPVVSTRCGGPEMLVRDGETGYLVANDDPEAMAQALVRLAEHPDQRRVMGERTRRIAEREFAREAVAEKFHQAFVDAFGSHGH